MAGNRPRSRSKSRPEDGTELWFTMPSFDRRLQPEQSAYRETSNRFSKGSMASNASQPILPIPAISTTPDINKSLPPPPPEAARKSRTPATIRSFIRGRPSGNHLDSSHLHPGQISHQQRQSSADAHLSVNVRDHYEQQHSHSMPNSPRGQCYNAASLYSSQFVRVQSAQPVVQDMAQYQPYSVAQDYPQRASSPNMPFDPSPTRARTFPETTILSPVARSSVSSRPRPHTWLSPTEPFDDASQFHLFVEAMTGLSDDTDPWSPNGPNRLQGSLFARRPSNGSIPVLSQFVAAPIPDRTHQTASWQSFEPPFTSSRSVSAPMSSTLHQDTFRPPAPDLTLHINAINAELEMLGLEGDHSDDDELPDYAQSQAEMNAKKREEAAARARDLEARWRGARNGRN